MFYGGCYPTALPLSSSQHSISLSASAFNYPDFKRLFQDCKSFLKSELFKIFLGDEIESSEKSYETELWDRLSGVLYTLLLYCLFHRAHYIFNKSSIYFKKIKTRKARLFSHWQLYSLWPKLFIRSEKRNLKIIYFLNQNSKNYSIQ